jgi:nucleotide-binding universal stress UspA family protein
MVILSTAHRLLSESERVQAQQVSGTVAAAALVPVAGNAVSSSAVSSGAVARGTGSRVILAAIDSSPVAALVTDAAARLAARGAGTVHLVHTQEDVTAGDTGTSGEELAAAQAVVRAHLDQLAAHQIPAEGKILLHAPDHGPAGRMVAEYADSIGASTIVIGAPTHGGLPALMDGSASRELWRHTRSNVLIINPEAPGELEGGETDGRTADAELLRG